MMHIDTLKTLALGAIVGLIAATATVTAHAGGASEQQRLAELKAARQNLAWRSHTTKPSAGLAHRREIRKIETLIDQLERGEQVDPAILDRATRQLR
jgi:hypothetical protein